MKKQPSHRATEDELGELHAIVARTIRQKLESGEATSADLSVAIKFLKDNNINCIAEQNDDMQKLIDTLPTYDIYTENYATQ